MSAIELEMTPRENGSGVCDVSVIVGGEVVSSYTVDPLGRKIRPMEPVERMMARNRIAMAALELADRALDGETLSVAEHDALMTLLVLQLDRGLRGE